MCIPEFIKVVQQNLYQIQVLVISSIACLFRSVHRVSQPLSVIVLKQSIYTEMLYLKLLDIVIRGLFVSKIV